MGPDRPWYSRRVIPARLRRALTRAALLAAFAAASPPTPARAERFFLPREREGGWLASDRPLHAAASAALAASFRVRGDREERAAALTIGIGVAKEVYDATLKPHRSGRGASRKDLVADLLGTAAGLLLFRALDR